MTVLDQLEAAGVIPVVVIDDGVDPVAVGDALVAGGLKCVEITLRTRSAEYAIEALAANSALTVGAGTVLSPTQVNRAVAAGARFVVAPGFDRGMVDRCRKLQVTVVPGVATPTDVMAALRAGLDCMKLFPAAPLGGLAYLRSLAAPFPGVRFVPTGGISADDVDGYLAEPAVLAVGGSWITPRPVVRAGRFDEIEVLAAAAAEMVSSARATTGTR